MKKALIIYPTDGKGGKLDDDGAFIPESIRVEKYYRRVFPDVQIKRIGVQIYAGMKPGPRKKAIFDILSANPGNDVVVFLCHGLKTSLPSFGFNDYGRDRGSVSLGNAIVSASPNVSKVIFYACLVSTGPDNFAVRVNNTIRPRTAAEFFSVFGHYSAGHTTKNPNIKIYDSEFMAFLYGKGRPYPQYNSLKAAPLFIELMRNEKSEFRFMVPFLPEIIRGLNLADHYKRSSK